MSLVVVIMAHPERAFQAHWLAKRVDADAIVYDVGHGENDTGDRAWRIVAQSHAEFGVVLQDDALPVDNFREHALAALYASDPLPVSFYVGTSRPHSLQVQHAVDWARVSEASWLEGQDMFWGVGIGMNVSMVSSMLTEIENSKLPYDRRIGRFFQSRRLPIRYTWPSLVDHRDGPSIMDRVSTRKPRTEKRVAHEVGIPTSWDGPVVKIPPVGARLHSSRT